VEILCERIEAGFAVTRPDADDRELPVEQDELLREFVVPQGLVAIHEPLSLPVVAQAPRLDERREPRVAEAAEPRGRDPQRAEELLLVQAVLAQLERLRSRHRTDTRGRLDGDVLELVRDHRGAVGQPVERRRVVVRRHDELADLARTGVRRRVEEPEREPERKAGEAEHAPELTAADACDERHPGVS
jgi:hypothetical protein